MSPRSETWSNIPPELLVTIVDRHSTDLDVLRLRSICRSWRNSISRDRPSDVSFWSIRIPLPILTLKGLYSLTKSTVCYVESPALRKRWLVKIEEFEEGRVRALDPVSLVKMFNFPKELNLIGLRVFEIARSYGLSLIEGEASLWNMVLGLRSKKVVVSSVDGNVKIDDLVMVIFEDGWLLYIRIGDEKWGDVQEWQRLKYFTDVIFLNERFYAVDSEGGLVIVDRKLNVEKWPWLGFLNSYDKKYLIVAGGHVFLVIWKVLSAREDDVEETRVGRVSEQYEASRFWFKVFRLKEKEKDWIRVHSLGELAFFVADDCSFSVVARDFPPYQPNCIYYVDYNDGDSTGQYCGVFNLEKKSFSESYGYCFISAEA